MLPHAPGTCSSKNYYVKKHVKKGNLDVKYGIKHGSHIYLQVKKDISMNF